MKRPLLASHLLCVSLFSLAACSSSPATSDDAGTVTDLGHEGDSGAVDAGHKTDAGNPVDAGQKDDAGNPTDAGNPADVVTPVDGGSAPDWGFRPNPNGFSFPNRGTSRAGETPVTARLDADNLRRLFGPVVCEGMNATGECRLVPNAAQWMNSENDGAHAGNCEGYTVFAAHLYAGSIAATAFGGPNAYALPLNDAVEREIMFWAITQVTVDQTLAPARPMSPRDLVTHLSAEFARGRSFLGTSVGVFGADGGHALLPYALRRRSDTVVELLVYDNNHPNTERFITLDTAANTWSYRAALNPTMPDAEWTGTDTVRPITIRDAGPRLALPHPSDAWQNRAMDGGGVNRVSINTVGDGQVTVTDGASHTTAVTADGRFVTDIPGSTVSLRMPGALSRPDPVFTVPRATPLTVTLDGAGLAAASPTELLFQGAGWTLGLEGVQLAPGQRDTLVIQPGQPDLLYRAAGAETPTLSLAYQTDGDDYLIEVRASSMTAGQNLRLKADFAGSSARVSFDGSTAAPTFEIYVERVSATGTVVFDHRGVTATAASALTINFGAWTGNGSPMSVGYDDNGDGTVDRTESLSDQD